MCLINFHYNQHTNYKLIIAANRDEFYNRPTEQAHLWTDAPNIIAGRDLEKYGTWLGITKGGRFAALTNYRDPAHMVPNDNSRGALVSNYLTSSDTPEDYIKTIQKMKDYYNGFNLLLGNQDHLIYYNNIENKVQPVTKGTHSLSNHFLNTPWPKVETGKNSLKNYVTQQHKVDPEVLFDILKNDKMAKDEDLPCTGVDLSLERQLSPLFINMKDYGTRCSTVLLITKNNDVHFIERTYHQGKYINEQEFKFKIDEMTK